ncbi:hypothetical protein ACJ73_10146 [Blastomyces percursus]|uniref:Uncharacterized protein n=1 Tax=Blastomyces percursus TaxID=1658174 RepID=A0A1J9Q3E3_9EURO|nr:hypothetical protein ACJ73_10146 [Blastomyces percursus]
MSTVNINGNDHVIGSSRGQARPQGLTPGLPSETKYILLHTSHPLKKRDKEVLAVKDVRIQEYVSPATYICAYSGKSLETVEKLPFISTAEEYPDSVVVHKDLQDAASGSQSARTIDITLHSDAKGDFELKKTIANLADIDVDKVEVAGDHSKKPENSGDSS